MIVLIEVSIVELLRRSDRRCHDDRTVHSGVPLVETTSSRGFTLRPKKRSYSLLNLHMAVKPMEARWTPNRYGVFVPDLEPMLSRRRVPERGTQTRGTKRRHPRFK
jgi:hypothetical protein